MPRAVKADSMDASSKSSTGSQRWFRASSACRAYVFQPIRPPIPVRIRSPVRSVYTVVPLALETHDLELHIAERYRFSRYDALIAAAALLLAGWGTLYSED